MFLKIPSVSRTWSLRGKLHNKLVQETPNGAPKATTKLAARSFPSDNSNGLSRCRVTFIGSKGVELQVQKCSFQQLCEIHPHCDVLEFQGNHPGDARWDMVMQGDSIGQKHSISQPPNTPTLFGWALLTRWRSKNSSMGSFATRASPT